MHGSSLRTKQHKYTISLQLTRPTLTSILQWLRSNHGVHPKAFLTDCDKSLTKAIEDAYKTSHTPPQHFWCVVHVIKAARRRAAGYVSSSIFIVTKPLLTDHNTGHWRSCQNAASSVRRYSLLTHAERNIYCLCRTMVRNSTTICRVCADPVGENHG